MKKTFLVKRNALLSSRGISAGVLALVLVVVILLVRLLAPNFFLKTITPVTRVSDVVAAQSHIFFTHFSDATTLALSNEKLQSENASLANENQILVKKVETLLALLNASVAQKDTQGLLLDVVARPPVSPYDTLVLAGGEKDGVRLGSEAFGENGAPIGVVSSVLSDFSRVTLFSTPGTETSGWVGKGNVPVTLTGTGAGTFAATISRAANIAVGDIVFVPGPGMRPIGSVVRVDSDPLSPGVTLRIMPASNLFSLGSVVLRATGVMPFSFATSTLP